jgi:hypothetical protein
MLRIIIHKVCCGVSISDFCPRRTTAPICASSSEGRPSIMSRCKDAVEFGARPSYIAIVICRASFGNNTSRDLAKAITSSNPFSATLRVSGRLRHIPTGERVTAPIPLQTVIRRNFIHLKVRGKTAKRMAPSRTRNGKSFGFKLNNL